MSGRAARRPVRRADAASRKLKRAIVASKGGAAKQATKRIAAKPADTEAESAAKRTKTQEAPGAWGGDTAALVEARGELEAALDGSSAAGALEALNALWVLGVPPRDVLIETRVCAAVAQARACAATAERASTLLAAWTRNNVADDMDDDASDNADDDDDAVDAVDDDAPVDEEGEEAAVAAVDDALGQRSSQGLGAPGAVRTVCKTLIFEALGAPDADDVARKIEACVHERHGDIGERYRLQCRSLVANLRSNDALRCDVLCGTVLPAVLCGMAPHEMLSDARRAEAEAEAEYNRLALLPNGGAAVQTTDQFKCPRCERKECTFYQMQTRSADEPMTIFIRCQYCGKNFRK